MLGFASLRRRLLGIVFLTTLFTAGFRATLGLTESVLTVAGRLATARLIDFFVVAAVLRLATGRRFTFAMASVLAWRDLDLARVDGSLRAVVAFLRFDPVAARFMRMSVETKETSRLAQRELSVCLNAAKFRT